MDFPLERLKVNMKHIRIAVIIVGTYLQLLQTGEYFETLISALG